MYLTDIVVNFQSYFLDYFDWNKFDKIDTLKKTFIFKVDNLENIIYLKKLVIKKKLLKFF